MLIKTANLIGLTLDWAVAESKGLSPYFDGERLCLHSDRGTDPECPAFSTDGGQAWPIIQRERIGFLPADGHRGNQCQAFVWEPSQHDLSFEDAISFRQYGSDLLVASMRCYVALTLGHEVDVPDELMSDGRLDNVSTGKIDET